MRKGSLMEARCRRAITMVISTQVRAGLGISFPDIKIVPG